VKGRLNNMSAGESFYLVTGGAGFIGSNLVELLLSKSLSVKVIDNFSTGKWDNLRSLQKKFSDRLQIVEGDIRNLPFLEKEFLGSQGIFHLAAIPSVQQSVNDPLTCHDANITGTLNVLLAARNQGVPRVVFASSCAIYGDSPELPKQEGMPSHPLSPYAVHKATGEQYARLFYTLYGLETYCLRFFNVFGPQQDPRSDYAAVIPRFIERMINKQKPIIYGDGEQTRDFIYVGDIVAANWAAMTAKAGSGEIFNIGTGQSHSLNELFRCLRNILQYQMDPQYESARPGDVRLSYADVDKAKRVLQFTASTDFETGLRNTLQWFQSKD